jgi:hypothetical protein
LYVVFNGSIKYYDFLIAFLVLTSVHWSFFKNECIISYLQKKINNCSYKLGDNYEAEDLKFMGSRLTIQIGRIVGLLLGLYICIKLKYNIPLYIFIQTISTVNPNKIIKILINVAAIYLLKDNQYLIPGIILIFASSLIVKYKDKNSCIRGSQVPDEQLEYKPL